MDVFEAMETARSMRFFRPDPVPDELVEKVLWAATRASNPGNSQGWDFVVVRDVEQRRRLGEAVGPIPATTPTGGRWPAPRTSSTPSATSPS